MQLVARDFIVLKEIGRWRFLLGRHVKVMCGFPSTGTADRRLKKLIEANYLERKRILYGVPGLYLLTHKGRLLIGQNKRAENIRVDKIAHDILALDTVAFLIKKLELTLNDITTEKELHQKDGFGTRRHYPDFIFTKDGKTACVEVELNLKAISIFEKNVQDNFLTYDKQLWIVPDLKGKIARVLLEYKNRYPNIKIMEVAKIQEKF